MPSQTIANLQIYNAYINGDMNKWATIIHFRKGIALDN